MYRAQSSRFALHRGGWGYHIWDAQQECALDRTFVERELALRVLRAVTGCRGCRHCWQPLAGAEAAVVEDVIGGQVLVDVYCANCAALPQLTDQCRVTAFLAGSALPL